MTIAELIKHLTDNLTDEQKAMDADMLDANGNVYTIDTILVGAVGEGNIGEGQPIFAAFGTSVEG